MLLCSQNINTVKTNRRMNSEHREAVEAAAAQYKNAGKILRVFLETASEKCDVRGGKILLAVSGGPDSVCLSHLTYLSMRALDIEPSIAHIDHNLRDDSEEDAQFCQRLANSLKFPFFLKKIDVNSYMRECQLSLETAARDLRHEALEALAKETGSDFIAFGHTLNDQAETVFHNIVRGGGLRGAAGIPYRYQKRVRPLLDIAKNDVLEFLHNNDVEYRIDETNTSLDFTRNRIRRVIFPVLENELNPAAQNALHRFSQAAQETELLLQMQAENAFDDLILEQSENKIVLDIERISTYFGVLRKYIIRHSLEVLSKRRIYLNYSILSRADALIADGRVGKRVYLAPPCELLIDHDGVVIRNRDARELNLECDFDAETALDERRSFLCLRIPAQKIDFTKNTTHLKQFVDADKVTGRIRLRNFAAGDRFFPLGAGGGKKVSDFFTDNKVPQHRKKEIPILECDAGIVWIVGHRIDERFKVTRQTKSLLQLEIKERRL